MILVSQLRVVFVKLHYIIKCVTYFSRLDQSIRSTHGFCCCLFACLFLKTVSYDSELYHLTYVASFFLPVSVEKSTEKQVLFHVQYLSFINSWFSPDRLQFVGFILCIYKNILVVFHHLIDEKEAFPKNGFTHVS